MASSFRPVREIIRDRSNEVVSLAFPESAATHGMLLIFREYSYTPSSERGFVSLGSSNISSTIFLPLPSNIADNYDLRVERFDQGLFGDAISQISSGIYRGEGLPDMESLFANMGGPAIENMVRAGTTILGGGAAFLASRSAAGAIVGGVIGDSLGAGSITSGIEAGIGALANPKAALQFKGVEMKRHNFDWTLSPKSETESERLQNIVRTIKKNVLPSYGGGETFQRALLKYPSFLDCFFVGLDPNHYFRFKPSMVQSFNVNYTPNGNAVLREGRPASVQMTMTMLESDIHTSEDYS
jgi:hypothetical protein